MTERGESGDCTSNGLQVLLRKVEAEKDGNCFFHAVLKNCVEGYGLDDHKKLRRDVIQFMEQDKDNYALFRYIYQSTPNEEAPDEETPEEKTAREKRNARTYREFLEDAKKTNEWVGEAVVVAASKFLRCVYLLHCCFTGW